MKKIIMSFVLLLMFNLCSCSNILPEETHTEELAGKEPLSVIFMGERIAAPGSYPDVPDLYAPVLDDLYLYHEVSQRYSSLAYEDRAEVMRECESVQSAIRKRGCLPYPGDGSGSGYALVDVDGDNSPELLILSNSPYYIHKPVIEAIFAMRNGQLVCIDNGSSELDYTILTADGTFYQCIDYRGAGYADLSAFRLEAGMSQFTIVTEARAALSFVEGDVPVPYWVKVENGEEISITEDEFDALLEQYKNPNEKMILDFVLLHPGADKPYSVSHPTDEPLIISIEYPDSYRGAPIEYKPILDALYYFSELLHREEDIDDFAWDEVWNELGFSEWPHGELGYAVVDLNNDGTFELLLGTEEGLNNAAPMSVFTQNSRKPVHLTSFWSRSRGVISADGTIYSVGSGGAAYTYLSSYRLDKNADTLTELTDMRSDYSFSEEKPYFYQVVDGKNHYITENEFWDFLEKYDKPSKLMRVSFIPISS